MAKFNSDDPDSIALLNRLASAAARHFGTGLCYFSDCLRDVEFLSDLEPGQFIWVVRDSGTWIANADDPSASAIVNLVETRATYSITKRQSEYGTTFYDIVRTSGHAEVEA